MDSGHGHAALLTESTTVIGIDEQTAFRAEPPEDLEQPWSFRGVGRGSCWRIESDRKYRVNSPMELSCLLYTSDAADE